MLHILNLGLRLKASISPTPVSRMLYSSDCAHFSMPLSVLYSVRGRDSRRALEYASNGAGDGKTRSLLAASRRSKWESYS